MLSIGRIASRPAGAEQGMRNGMTRGKRKKKKHPFGGCLFRGSPGFFPYILKFSNGFGLTTGGDWEPPAREQAASEPFEGRRIAADCLRRWLPFFEGTAFLWILRKSERNTTILDCSPILRHFRLGAVDRMVFLKKTCLNACHVPHADSSH